MKTWHPFACVAALDAEGGIAREGGIPWKVKADVAFFKRLTTSAHPDEAVRESGMQTVEPEEDGFEAVPTRPVGPLGRSPNAVIMGRRTWESLPARFRPLDGRFNLVLTHSDLDSPGAVPCEDLEEALVRAQGEQCGLVYIIGGAKTYREGIRYPSCVHLYLTEIRAAYACDVFFPQYQKAYHLALASPWQFEGELEYRFTRWDRNGEPPYPSNAV